MNKPLFSIYIPSKGRFENKVRWTSIYLDSINVPYKLVIEPQEYKKYLQTVKDRKKLLVLDMEYKNKYDYCDSYFLSKKTGSGPARQFILEYSKEKKEKWHWCMDDNIKSFVRLNQNRKLRVQNSAIIRAMEDFVLKYKNVALAGPNYDYFAVDAMKYKPFRVNKRVYSCILINNEISLEWKGRHNEDTILNLNALSKGYCTIQFMAFLQEKAGTMTMKGGNTEEFYKNDNRLYVSQLLQKQFPDITKVVRRYGRWHHHVDYSQFTQKLIRKDKLEKKQINNYGMKPVKSKNAMTNFFEIKGKKLLSKCPPDVDEKKWQIFREEFTQCEEFNDIGHPVQLDIELNGGCNMKCPFCIHGYQKIENKQLTEDQFKKLIHEAITFGIKSIKFNYINEPMLKKDLEKYIKYARDKGILNVYMVTNGTLLNEKRRESMLLSGITKVFVSIDAVTKETYEKQRLSGQFEKVKNNIKKFIELRNSKNMQFPLVRVSFLKNKINIHEKDQFEEEWSGIADIINFQTMNEVPNISSGLLVEKSQLPEKGCSFPFKQLVVNHEGGIQPCCKLNGKKLVVGNINNMTLKEAWKSDKFKTLRKEHKNGEWISNKICYECMMPN